VPYRARVVVKIGAGAAVGSLGLITSAFAQIEASPASPSTSAALGEVVVTAERREENANQIDMSITTADSAALASARVENVQDLGLLVPGLTVVKGPVPVYTLRGVGFNSTNLGATGAVGTYVDEIPYAYPAMMGGPIFDVTRIEVLKGPQGTLYGRNTTGGLIDQITNKPTDTFAGGLQVEFGNYATHNFEGFVNVPLLPSLRMRLSFRTEDSEDGWQHSLSRPGDTLGGIHDFGARGQIDWTPTDSSDLRFCVNYWENHSDTQAAQYGALLPTSTTPPTSLFLNPAYGFGAPRPLTPPVSSSAADWEPSSLREANTAASSGIDSALVYDDRFYSVALHARQQLGENLSLVSLTGYNDLNPTNTDDDGGVPIEVNTHQNSGYARSFSEEARLDYAKGPVHWLFGGYYGDDHIYEQDKGLAGQAAVISILRTVGEAVIDPAAQADYPAVKLNPAGITPAQIAGGFRDFMYTGLYHNTVSSAFASATWNIRTMFDLSAGLRYSQERLNVQTGVRDSGDGSAVAIWDTAVRYANLVGGIGPAAGLLAGVPAPIVRADPGVAAAGQWLTLNSAGKFSLVPIPEHLDQNPITWRLSFDFKPDSDTLTYASISYGTKSGTVPVTAADSFKQVSPAEDEKLLAYEIGVKRTLFDRSVQANASLFYYLYRDKQLTANILDPVFGVLPQLQNVPRSFVDGLEWDLAWRAGRDLTISYQGTLIHTEITDFTAINGFGDLVSYKGAPFSNAPSFQTSLRFDYERPISGTTGVRLSLAGSIQSASFSIVPAPGDTTDALYRNPGYGLVNGSTGLYTLNGKWEAMLWARNITNAHYFTGTIATIDATARFPGMPTTFGILISSHF
jgi:iron complex outermembrane recepter protein